MEKSLGEKCEELIQRLDEYDLELRDCMHAVAEYRARVREIMAHHVPVERGRDLFDELDSFLAQDR